MQSFRNRNAHIQTFNHRNGARHYYLPEAFRERYGIDVNVSSLRAKRYLEKEAWNVKIWEEKNISTLFECENLLIPDTVATGTTLAGVLDTLLRSRISGPLPNIYVFTIAGSDSCVKRLKPVYENILKKRGATLTVVFSNAMFNLDSNGTDLGFEHAKIHTESEKMFDKILGSFPRSSMKCAIFDWGDRFRSPIEHLLEVRSHFEGIKTTPKFILDGIEKRLIKLKE